MWPIDGGAENASTGKGKYENSAFRKDGKRHVRKMQVRICRDGKRKYSANLQSDKKKFDTSQVSAFLSGVRKWITDCFFLR